MTLISPRLKWLCTRIIAILPSHAVRLLLYRLCFRYELQGSRVGFGTVIDVKALSANGVRIGRFNKFTGPMAVRVGSGTTIGDRNTFICAEWSLSEARFRRSLEIGRDCLLTSMHFFDVTGSVAVGDGSWFAGRGSEVWTHGAGSHASDVRVGRCSYIGSACRFAPGSAVGDGCLVAMGSVVGSSFDANDALIGGVPARIIRQPYSWPSKRDRASL